MFKHERIIRTVSDIMYTLPARYAFYFNAGTVDSSTQVKPQTARPPLLSVTGLQYFENKTGTRQCTRAVWSTFAEIHSIHPVALMHDLGLLEFPVRICAHHNKQKTYLIYPMIAISENTWSFDYF